MTNMAISAQERKHLIHKLDESRKVLGVNDIVHKTVEG